MPFPVGQGSHQALLPMGRLPNTTGALVVETTEVVVAEVAPTGTLVVLTGTAVVWHWDWKLPRLQMSNIPLRDLIVDADASANTASADEPNRLDSAVHPPSWSVLKRKDQAAHDRIYRRELIGSPGPLESR